MKHNKFKIYTLGCKVNQYDAGRLASTLIRTGFAVVNKNADLAIINSCTVTETAVKKCRRMIKLAKKENPGAKIALVGCWPRAGEVQEKVAGVDLVLRDSDVNSLVKQIFNFPRSYVRDKQFSPKLRSGQAIFKQFNNFSIFKTNKCHNLAMTDRARYFIKIQDGCEQYCSYCIVPYVRGKMTSRPKREVIDEIKEAVEAGYREVVLSGIHLGLYGKEVRSKKLPVSPTASRGGEVRSDLISILKKIIEINGLGRVRLSSIEITEVSDELINLIAGSKKICRHLHIPLQSGSNKILKLMNRPYSITNYELRIKNIRKIIPDIAITTDIIVGFPGETEKDFRNTMKFIKQIKFSRLHVFPFSAHEKTPAVKFPGQVEEKIKARRAKILRQLGVKLMSDYKKKFKDRELEIVVEQIKQGKIMGKTEYYFEVEVAGKKIKNKNLKAGEMVKVIY